MIQLKSKAQSWSIDIALGVVIFIGAFFLFYAILNQNPNTKVTKLKEDATFVIKQATAEGGIIVIINNSEIDISKVNALKDLSYDELKRRLRVDSDFCLYLEDEKGNLILINNNYKGVGAPNIDLGGTPCSQK